MKTNELYNKMLLTVCMNVYGHDHIYNNMEINNDWESVKLNKHSSNIISWVRENSNTKDIDWIWIIYPNRESRFYFKNKEDLIFLF